MEHIYADNAATSFPKADGLDCYLSSFIAKDCVNINRGTYSLSYDVQNTVMETREKLVSFFDCSDDILSFSKRVIFTSGITLSINMFLRGFLHRGDHIITGPMEHHAVMRTLYDLKKNRGIEFTCVKADKYGCADLNDLVKSVKNNTKAIFINHASNVFGSVNDIEKIGRIADGYGLIFGVDTAQTAGVIDISMRKSKIDFLAFSAHKGLLALQGLGGFIMSNKLDKRLVPVITGGSGSISHSYEQPGILPDRFESGTLNLPGIAALNYSLSFLERTGIDNIRRHELMLRKRFIKGIADLENVKIYNADINENRTVCVISAGFLNIDNAEAAFILDSEYGIFVRQGLHCSLSAHETMGTDISGTVRFSFGYHTTIDEVDACIDAVRRIATK